MGRVFMRKISEILRQRFELNLSYRVIADSLGLSIGSIAHYIYRAKACRYKLAVARRNNRLRAI